MQRGKRELLFSVGKKDLRVDTFRSGGNGGQYQNTTDSGVRIVHEESGAAGESRSERSQLQNRKLALQRMVKNPKFKSWHKRKVAEILYKKESVEKAVEREMASENLKVEIKVDGKWTAAVQNENGDWVPA